jgi:hypothetical protein
MLEFFIYIDQNSNYSLGRLNQRVTQKRGSVDIG